MLITNKLTITTFVYGNRYVDLFEKCCLRSLFQEGNIPFLLKHGYEITHLVYTTTPDAGRLAEITNRAKLKYLEGTNVDQDKLSYQIITNPAVGYGRVIAKTNMIFLLQSVTYGVHNPAPFFLASPDYFIGDYSLSNLLAYQTKKDTCLAALHVRVDAPSFLNFLEGTQGNIQNPSLVRIAFGMLSQSWKDSFIDKDNNCSFHAGTAVQKIATNLYTVTFRIPTTFLARLNQSDLEYFSGHCDYGHWDHSWPEHLISQKRFKFIGSSDMFFAVELTAGDMNQSKCRAGDLWNDEYFSTKIHSETNRNFLAVVRGDGE